jgi:Ca-activated chloride channel homolog
MSSLIKFPVSHPLSRPLSCTAISRSLLPMASLLMASCAMVIGAAPAFAMQDVAADKDASKDLGPQSGTLMLQGKDAKASINAVQLGSDMDVTISGSIARVRVTQVFRNTSSDWMEATYLYPLPEEAAVDSLKMVVGQKVIIGEIKKREEAREIYETAKEEGKKAGLVEQQRPNMFSNSVANIGPGETVMIVIEYQMPLRQLDGTFAMRLPLVVAPRYVPPHSTADAKTQADTDKITAAPVLDPKSNDPVNPVSIKVKLDTGYKAANINSAYHQVNVTGRDGQKLVELATDTVPADRDFELTWRSAESDPKVALYTQQLGDKAYVMASITPPVEDKEREAPPREMIFVIDNSGSMSGESMDQAKASLVNALSTLRSQDYFNVIRFDDTMTELFDRSIPATTEMVAKAINYANSLEASGGTEMLPALKAALAGAATSTQIKAVRQIIFLTDGSISNEKEMIEAIAADNGRSRVFMVGIGSAPNNYLMNRMSNMGRGTYTNIGSTKDVTVKMERLIDMLSRPSVQDLSVTVNGNAFDLTPKLLPDLYAGEPLLLMGQADKAEGSVTVSGRIGTRQWTQTVDFKNAMISPSVAKAWARKRIDDIEADRALGVMTEEAADAAVTEIGLEFAIVTSMTSLVAVDKTPSRPAGEPLKEADLPINLPAGWDFERLFGGDTAVAAMANDTATVAKETKQFDLPQGANNYAQRLFGGLLAFIIGAFGFISIRRKKEV